MARGGGGLTEQDGQSFSYMEGLGGDGKNGVGGQTAVPKLHVLQCHSIMDTFLPIYLLARPINNHLGTWRPFACSTMLANHTSGFQLQ